MDYVAHSGSLGEVDQPETQTDRPKPTSLNLHQSTTLLTPIHRPTHPPLTRLIRSLAPPMKASSSVLSHIGSLPVRIPTNVKLIQTSQLLLTSLSISGPLGTKQVSIPRYINLDSSSPHQLSLSLLDRGVAQHRARWGLSRTLIDNAVVGVSQGYTKELNLVGVGYRASMASPTQLHLKLGFAHPVLIDLPSDVTAATPSSTSIVLSGIDKQRVGEVAARIRSWRVPEPYNVSRSSRLDQSGARWLNLSRLGAGQGNLRRQRTSTQEGSEEKVEYKVD